jgi:N-acetylmuramoyl-L-alanine amidase
VPVKPGTNHISFVTCSGSQTSRWTRSFRVAFPRVKAPSAAAAKGPPKVVEKLPYARDLPQPHPTGKKPADVTIVLDPGHGGPKDAGALSPHGWCEKDVNLLLARDVRKALEKRGYRVVLTRESDVALPLRERPRKAHAEKAEAFVSLHHNAPPVDRPAGKIRYSGVYAWNPLGLALAKAIADRLPAAQGAQVPGKGAIQANFVVVRNPEIPSCLVESDFITHPEGEAASWDPVRRARIAEAIADGISSWHRTAPAAIKEP